MVENTENEINGTEMNDWIAYINPVIPKRWLLIIGGVMWTGVGILLISLAVGWLIAAPSFGMLLLGLLGVGISILANRAQFTKLAKKNIRRILSLGEKASVFAFQAWTGYLIIAVMMTGGMLLRHSVVPKPDLAVVYLSIGGALLQASVHYYIQFFQRIAEAA
jgi:hypothetical protein